MKLVPTRLFWKLGISYLVLLACVLIAFALYSSRVLRLNYIRLANDNLSSLLNIARTHLPRSDDPSDLRAFTASMAVSGVRVTLISQTGEVLADSAQDAETAENHAGWPEIAQAFASGEGQSVRHSAIFRADTVYQAVRYQTADGSLAVIEMAAPLTGLESSLADLHRQLSVLALIALLIFGAISFVSFRVFDVRVERLTEFSRGLARGDFRPLPSEGSRDQLAGLAHSLNEAAAWMDRTIRSLSGERNRSSAILRSMVEGVAVIDAHEKLIFSNRAFSDILNLNPLLIESRPVIEVVRNSELLGLIRRALGGEEGVRSDITIGIVQQRTFSITATPIQALETNLPLASGHAPRGEAVAAPENPSGAVIVLHDVSELRRLERVRQDFVANVSHEFKTPLTAIQGFAETLLAGALEDPRNNRRFLEIIRDHAARLAELTNDLLKLARIEAGKLEVEFGPVGVMELIEQCTETALLKASRRQVTLETAVPSALPPVLGDAGLLRDVLQNLLDNAIQYTSAGGHICISAAVNAAEIVITVADTGIGIPVADQERIFERFYRVDAGRSRDVGGTGLGLSIARHIVEAHGGRLWLESEVGHGSKFFFSVSLAD